MGVIKLFSSSTYDYPKYNCNQTIVINNPAANPNPLKYTINDVYYQAPYLLISINYPDCTNYEGNKILLYKNVTLENLIKQKSIDPHFSDNIKYHSPIARFEPTDKGWNMAKELINTLK